MTATTIMAEAPARAPGVSAERRDAGTADPLGLRGLSYDEGVAALSPNRFVQRKPTPGSGSGTTSASPAPPSGDGARGADEQVAYTPPGPLPPDHHALVPGEHDHAPPKPDGGKKAGTPAPDPHKEEGDDAKPAADGTGIATKAAVGRFITAAKEVQKKWGELGTNERASKLGKAANDELKAVSVPETTPKVEDLGTTAGVMAISTWTLKLGEKRFDKATIDDDWAATIADDVYHEARHAEQWHRMARQLAGQGKDAKGIKEKMSNLPAEICADAAGKPLTGSGAEQTEANDWYQSVYGSKAAEREEIYKKKDELRVTMDAAEGPLDTAKKAYEAIKDKAGVTKEAKDAAYNEWVAKYNVWKTAYDAWKVWYDKYRALPEEADAWALGSKVQEQYKKP